MIAAAPARVASTATERARHLLHGVVDNAPQGIRPEWLLLHGVPAEEIAGRAYGVIDLLFVGSHGYGPLRRALLGNVSGALVRAAGCPSWSPRARGRAAPCAGSPQRTRDAPFRRPADSSPSGPHGLPSCGSGYVIPADWAERTRPGGSAALR